MLVSLHNHLDPAWRRAEWDREALLFTGDLDVDRGVVVLRPGMPHRDPRSQPALRWLPAGAVILGVCSEGFDAATANCTGAACVSGRNAPSAKGSPKSVEAFAAGLVEARTGLPDRRLAPASTRT